MIAELFNPHTVWKVLHLAGVVVGMGGALASDLMFLSAVKDFHISQTEMRFLRLGGRMVWAGLGMILISGTFLVLERPDVFLASAKFLAKMTVVAVILANGIFLHLRLIPRIDRHVGGHLPSSDEFIRKRYEMFSSGAVSLVSWTSALILGALRSLPFDYSHLMLTYVAVLALAIACANVVGRATLPSHQRLPR